MEILNFPRLGGQEFFGSLITSLSWEFEMIFRLAMLRRRWESHGSFCPGAYFCQLKPQAAQLRLNLFLFEFADAKE